MSNRPSSNVSKELRKFTKDYDKVMTVIYSMNFKMRALLAVRLLIKRFR
jgi:hypothetical protein